jgi:hypothetical protein
MSGTTARANDTSPVHGLGGDHRDCTVIRERSKRRPGSNKLGCAQESAMNVGLAGSSGFLVVERVLPRT